MAPWPAVLGINLWLVTLVVPLLLRQQAVPATTWALLPLSPMLLLFSLRLPEHRLAAPALLLVVPLLSMVPAADGPLADERLHPRSSAVLLCAVLISYLIACARALARRPAGASVSGDREAAASVRFLSPVDVPQRWRRRIFIYRALFVLSLAIPGVMLHGIALHPPHVRALAESLGDSSRLGFVQAALTAAVALFWIVAFRFYFMGPLHSHLEQDRDTQRRGARTLTEARRGRPRVHFYLAMTLALLSMIILIARSLRG